MICITNVVINISGGNGVLLLKETHALYLGPAGLLRVPGRLGLDVQDLACFPSQEEVADASNKGAPFDGLCDIFKQGCGPIVTTTLVTGGFARLESTLAEVWVRVESAQPFASENQSLSTGQTCVNSRGDMSTGPRQHLCSDVRSRIKILCNLVCPRSADGLWLPEKASNMNKRPAWCFDKIMDSLRDEFDEEKLQGVHLKTRKYLSRTALSYKRLQSLTKDDWLAMGDDEREANRDFIKAFEQGVEAWERGPYGHYWLDLKMTRQPTAKELQDYARRDSRTSTVTLPISR